MAEQIDFFSQKFIFARSSADQTCCFSSLVLDATTRIRARPGPLTASSCCCSHLHLVSPPFIDTLSHQSARRTTQTRIPPSPPCPERRVPKQRHLARHRPLDSVLPIRSPVIYPPIGSTHEELKGLTNHLLYPSRATTYWHIGHTNLRHATRAAALSPDSYIATPPGTASASTSTSRSRPPSPGYEPSSCSCVGYHSPSWLLCCLTQSPQPPLRPGHLDLPRCPCRCARSLVAPRLPRPSHPTTSLSRS